MLAGIFVPVAFFASRNFSASRIFFVPAANFQELLCQSHFFFASRNFCASRIFVPAAFFWLAGIFVPAGIFC